MNHLITKPQGLDYEIQYAQKVLYDELTTLWNISLDGYGRIYKKFQEGKVIPEAYLGKGDYSGNLIEEKNKFFFSKDSSSQKDEFDTYTCKVGIYFILNLKEAKPLILHRADQEVQADVMKSIKQCAFNSVDGIEDTDFDTIISEFRSVFNTLQDFDRQPNHIFKVNVTIVYNFNNKCDG